MDSIPEKGKFIIKRNYENAANLNSYNFRWTNIYQKVLYVDLKG